MLAATLKYYAATKIETIDAKVILFWGYVSLLLD